MRKYWITISLVIIILTSFLLMFFSARQDSLTVDEKVHISAGFLHVWQGDYTFNSEHPPLLNDLAGLFAKIARPNLPERPLNTFDATEQWDFGDLFFYESGNNVEAIIFWARLPFILLTLGLIYLCFLFGKAVFGKKAGLLAAALAGFSPNILAHGRLATTDIGVAFFFLLTVWLLRKYFLKPSWINALILGIGIGFTILSKFSGLLILPVVLGGSIIFWVKAVTLRKPLFLKYFNQFLFVIFTATILIWSVYLFSMRAQVDGALIRAPIDKFLQGWQILADHNQAGHWNYLNGVVNYQGWWYYFLAVLWYKLTLPVLILLGLAIFFSRYKKDFLGEYLLIFPGLLFLGVSLTSHIDIGIRHILSVLPFIFIFISGLANVKNLILKPIIWLLVAGHILVGILAFPNYLAYFNQIAGGSQNGLKHLSDSNLDWNQNVKRFAEYAKENNINHIYELCWDQGSFEYYGIRNDILPNSPVNGVVVICAQQLVITPEGFDFSWVTKYPLMTSLAILFMFGVLTKND